MKRVPQIIVIVIVAIVLILGITAAFFMRELNYVHSLTINEVQPAKLSDGVYNGKLESGFRSNELAITIKDKRITKIDIVKDSKFPVDELRKQVYPELFRMVIQKQSTKIDTISGATVTTKQYLKSIDNALNF